MGVGKCPHAAMEQIVLNNLTNKSVSINAGNNRLFSVRQSKTFNCIIKLKHVRIIMNYMK